jgi:hypothetical protein
MIVVLWLSCDCCFFSEQVLHIWQPVFDPEIEPLGRRRHCAVNVEEVVTIENLRGRVLILPEFNARAQGASLLLKPSSQSCNELTTASIRRRLPGCPPLPNGEQYMLFPMKSNMRGPG